MSREDRIRDRAYLLWQSEGRPDGRSTQHWFAAAAQIDREDLAIAGTADDANAATQRLPAAADAPASLTAGTAAPRKLRATKTPPVAAAAEPTAPKATVRATAAGKATAKKPARAKSEAPLH